MIQATPLVMRVATNERQDHEPYEDVYTSQDENMLRDMHQVQMSTMWDSLQSFGGSTKT